MKIEIELEQLEALEADLAGIERKYANKSRKGFKSEEEANHARLVWRGCFALQDALKLARGVAQKRSANA